MDNTTWEYKVPSALDIPADLRLELYNSGKNKGLVLGSKAVGERTRNKADPSQVFFVAPAALYVMMLCYPKQGIFLSDFDIYAYEYRK